MFAEILNTIKSGGTVSVEDLSVRLNSPPETVEAALEQLTRMGYLSLSSTKDCGGCSGKSCAGCSAACGYGGPEIRWYGICSEK